MIPYFSFIKIYFGPFALQVWGTLAALGLIASLGIGWRLVQKRGLSADFWLNLFWWTTASSLLFARLFYVIWGGEQAYFLSQPWQMLAIWQGGMMSSGGFFGAALALLIFWRREQKKLLPYFDVVAFSFPFGWLLGRLGCFLIHDHPGRLTKSFLAVNFVNGARWDLGLLEALITAIIIIAFILLSRRPRPTGFYPAALLIGYGLSRFWLDFLRATDLPQSDQRWLGLTLAQYVAIVIFFGGIVWAKKIKKGGVAS